MNFKRRIENKDFKKVKKFYEKMEKNGVSRKMILQTMKIMIENMERGIPFDLTVDYENGFIEFLEYDAA